MKDINFPINLVFNIGTIANDFSATDANNKTIAYVKQKLFKLKEDVLVYSDENKSQINYTIKADRWIDFSAAYSIKDERTKKELGKIARKGWRSLWKAEYDIIDQHQKPQYKIKEKSALTRLLDSLFGEIPILSFFTGYLFNPTYLVTDNYNNVIVEMKKEPSFFGRKFSITKNRDIDQDDQERVILSLMMMVLLERRRG
ncbi:MAG: hypothetical protein HRU50_15600 [Winogradskyella sp.]|uniref:hypothetical protein n=1 Tax=Winogradskyella sp. TaxID=1883156 RepID=UPI0025D2524B|nr:hypothetical protein [Winogradskyella sp.]NRB61347.1 hypothetical protein [Winogradskyella sp.]